MIERVESSGAHVTYARLQPETPPPPSRARGYEPEMTSGREQNVSTPETETSDQFWAWLRDVAETLLLAAVIFIVVNTLTGRYEVQSISMEPTLHEGQYLIVSKIAYWFGQPQRGDIVVLDPPEGRSTIPYIKRVIGLPGEHVVVKEGRVWINGIALNEPYISGPALYNEDTVLTVDEYLVLGDNRNNSSDSHVWGALPEDHIVGKAVFRYWPPDKWGMIPHYMFPELEGTP